MKPLVIATGIAILVTLSACGGGGDPAPVTITQPVVPGVPVTPVVPTMPVVPVAPACPVVPVAPVCPVVPVPAVEVVVLKKIISRNNNAVEPEILPLVIRQIEILEIRCVNLGRDPLSMSNFLGFEYLLLIDLAAADVEKAKAFGFSVFTAAENARKSAGLCNG